MVRIQLGPDKLDGFVEYAPCTEGAAPAFRHSAQNLELLLEACDATFKKGYLINLPYFDDKEFKQRFPNMKHITTERWRHAYLALKVKTQTI